mgnify:CR=1 FL=1
MIKNKNILIVGVGEIGSRHLQAISKLKNVSIEVIDPDKNSIKIAKSRLPDINSNNVLNFYGSIELINANIDLAIISTSSRVRFNVTKEIISKKNVKNIVFEKVLFQKEKDYYKMQKLLKENNIKAWVNHPRRMFPFYKKLKNELKKSNNIIFNYTGYNWAMASNGLHLIDLISFLSDSNELIINNSMIDRKIIKSKRNGFLEVLGSIQGKVGDSFFNLSSVDYKIKPTMTIYSENHIFVIDEAMGEVYHRNAGNDWMSNKYHEKIIFFQSELSNDFTSEILEKNSCSLPKYEDSIKLHIPFIKSLIEHFNRTGLEEIDYCNIT